MLSLSQTTGYAIEALAHLNPPGGEPLLLREVARRAKVPGAYLAKRMPDLVAAGLVVSRRGQRGGLVLAREPAKITLLEISEAVEARRWLAGESPSVALVEDNSDNFVTATLAATVGSVVGAAGPPAVSVTRMTTVPTLDVVEMYPYVPYIQYLLPGSIAMSIFMMVMIGGGIIFIDDKARGLHAGYLVTPITKFELIAGFNLSGTIRAILAGGTIMIIGSIIAGVPNPLDPMRLLRMMAVISVTSFALISMMFLLMVRVTDPLLPRAMFGVLNTVLYFPSGAVYPQQGFPGWLQAIAVVDPFTYAVHAFKSLLLKNTGFEAIGFDLLFLCAFSLVAMTLATRLFRRTL